MHNASHQSVDLLIIGGGINGAGIARDAAGRGLSVCLVEQDDLASHTSSAATKLIHGGLRYLEYYEFRLVREALIERERLLGIAPHIIWPMRCDWDCLCTITLAHASDCRRRRACDWVIAHSASRCKRICNTALCIRIVGYKTAAW
jgi:glycine/D-amino acid oxidase-like deaminating enzyme